jgi:hypothetical protein
MSNINGYPETCESCGLRRTCNRDGLCHECAQGEREHELEQEQPHGRGWAERPMNPNG